MLGPPSAAEQAAAGELKMVGYSKQLFVDARRAGDIGASRLAAAVDLVTLAMIAAAAILLMSLL